MSTKVEDVNFNILRQCREQIFGDSFDKVEKKIKKIRDLEAGKSYPTFKQLETLGELYLVPEWVFISKHLPDEYCFDQKPSFRHFKENRKNPFDQPKVRALHIKVERLRELILELREDMDLPIPKVSLPVLQANENTEEVARRVRKWLGSERTHHDFAAWRNKLEDKNIFVFTTSRMAGWSNIPERANEVEKEVKKNAFRGIASYYDKLPLIIINSSDTWKAQSYTLFHELGHLLKGKSEIGSWDENNKKTELWCDDLAGCILMPKEEIETSQKINDLKTIQNIAEKFKVSQLACLVRLRRLNLINQTSYTLWRVELWKDYIKIKKERKANPTPIRRNLVTEVMTQYGRIYTRTVVQAYYDEQIQLHKLCKFLNLKDPTQALALAKRS